MLEEATTSLGIIASLGTNGVFFSTVMSQDPLSNLERFVCSIEKQVYDKQKYFRVVPDDV